MSCPTGECVRKESVGREMEKPKIQRRVRVFGEASDGESDQMVMMLLNDWSKVVMRWSKLLTMGSLASSADSVRRAVVMADRSRLQLLSRVHAKAEIK